MIGVAACAAYDEKTVTESVRRLLTTLSGIEDLVRGKNVVVKPNLLLPRTPEDATTTHPVLLRALALAVLGAGAASVTVAESGGGIYNEEMLHKLYRACGVTAALSDTAAQLNFDCSSVTLACPEGKRIKQMQILRPIAQADVVISVGKLKTHGLTGMSGAVKNLFGTVPGLTKPALHGRFPSRRAFSEMLVDLCELTRPALSILDAVWCMEGEGPSAGKPKFAGVLLGGTNPYEVDVAAARLMGFPADSLPILRAARARNLLPDPVYAGDPLPQLAFEPPSKGWLKDPVLKYFAPYPRVTTHCVGCGACGTVCPEGAITVEKGRAHVKKRLCIRCYCCHEICPIRAITIKRIGGNHAPDV